VPAATDTENIRRQVLTGTAVHAGEEAAEQPGSTKRSPLLPFVVSTPLMLSGPPPVFRIVKGLAALAVPIGVSGGCGPYLPAWK